MSSLVEAAGRIASRVAERFLKIGPTDEPVAWLSVVATALLAYQEAATSGLGPEDAIVGAAIAAITLLVRADVTPSSHLPAAAGEPIEVPPPPFFPEEA